MKSKLQKENDRRRIFKKYLENAEAKGNESLAENCRKKLKSIPEAKFLNKSNFENDKNKGGQALLIILALLSIVGYGIGTILFCNWYSEKSISLLIMVIILATIPFLLGIGMQYALKLDEEKYVGNYVVFNKVLFNISLFISFISLIFIIFLKTKNIPTIIFIISLGSSIILFIGQARNRCRNCSFYGTTLVTNEEKYEYVDKGYVSGGYEYTKYDVKDSNGKQLGTIETKGEYKEGYSYVKGTAYKTIYHYKCSCCGYEHKK